MADPQEHADDPERQVELKRMLALAKPEWKTLVWATVFLAIGASAGLAYPQAIRVIIDSALGEDKDPGMIDAAALVMGLIFSVQAVSMALRSYLFTVAGERVVARLRTSLFASIMSREIAFFDTRRTGELLNRLSSDTTVLQNTVTVNVSMGLRHLATSVGGIALLFYTSPPLTLIMLVVVPPVALGAVYFGRKLRRISRRVQDALAASAEVAEETISGIRTVRSFAREPLEVDRYANQVETSFNLAKHRMRLNAVFIAVTTFAGYAAIAVVLWYGGHLVIDGEMSVGDLTSFVLYTLIVAISIGALGGLWGDFMRASGSAERIFALLDDAVDPGGAGSSALQAASSAEQGYVEMPEPRPEVPAAVLDDVHFSYPSRADVTVLNGLSLALDTGAKVALVGASGGGKSTVAQLLARFYDPNEGAVRIHGVDVRSLDPDDIRSRIGAVAQEPVLFSTSISENIRYGRRNATQEEIVEAAKVANADAFIREFPDGYDTPVGERGVQLSGGQKQRVAIARAVLKDPEILILDEATSALDAESEELVKEALARLMEGRTTLIIAHRLSTVRDADRVVVLDAGKVVESGSHDELLELDGAYKRLVTRQFNH